MSLHVVFGAGQVGSRLAELLRSQGHQVRVVRRSAATVPGIEVVSGDARDVEFCKRVTTGAAAIYHCMNPSTYSGAAWEAEFPAVGEALIAAAVASGARLVCLDNLYAYGISADPRTESTPLRAEGRKGKVRIAWDLRLREAANNDGLRFAVGRAGDFFGPGAGEHSLMSPAALSGGAPWLIGDADAPHAFSFIPDVVEGLAALGTADDVDGQFYNLPVIQVSPRALTVRIGEALQIRARPRVLPAFAVGLLGPFVSLFGELRETLYQWDRPFLVDDRKFKTRFPGLGSDLDRAAVATAAELQRVRSAA